MEIDCVSDKPSWWCVYRRHQVGPRSAMQPVAVNPSAAMCGDLPLYSMGDASDLLRKGADRQILSFPKMSPKGQVRLQPKT